MLIPPKYTLTASISKLLSSIEVSREVIESFELDPVIESNIRRQSTLSSSLYSARIEGNPLSLEEVNALSSQNQKKVEVFNLFSALEFVKERKKREIDVNEILTLHRIVIAGKGKKISIVGFRSNMEAIFNSAGVAVYMPPPPRLVNSLIVKLISYVNSDDERLIPVKAVISHYIFEKIHPFLDGNGRVGRLLMQRILSSGGYAMKGLLPLEEYLDNHRSSYYRMLQEPDKDLTDYVEFMLTAIAETAKKSKILIMEKQKPSSEDYLLPRRAEIYRIIKDHKMVSFGEVRRRFGKVNERTLRYDLKKLQDHNFIRKLGKTRGVFYVKNKT